MVISDIAIPAASVGPSDPRNAAPRHPGLPTTSLGRLVAVAPVPGPPRLALGRLCGSGPTGRMEEHHRAGGGWGGRKSVRPGPFRRPRTSHGASVPHLHPPPGARGRLVMPGRPGDGLWALRRLCGGPRGSYWRIDPKLQVFLGFYLIKKKQNYIVF